MSDAPLLGYEVRIGEGLLDEAGPVLARHARPGPALVVTDENVGPLYLARVTASLASAGFAPAAVTIPAGEGSKTLSTLTGLYGALLSLGADRGTPVVGLGGGVVTDLAGCAAATFLRGIPWLPLPTSLLGQVDASVGGKTGVNLPEGKNLVGAIHRPVAVLADLTTLATLPDRQVRNGLAEVVKAGLALDPDLFDAVEGDPGTPASHVSAAVAAKARVVAEDEREAGHRRVLNLGHTAGHAIEAATGYGPVLHGEAVAVGLVASARMSVARGLLEEGVVDRVRAVLRGIGLPVDLADLPEVPEREAVREHLTRDKKRKGGRTVLVLLEGVGRAVVVEDGTEEEVLAAVFGC